MHLCHGAIDFTSNSLKSIPLSTRSYCYVFAHSYKKLFVNTIAIKQLIDTRKYAPAPPKAEKIQDYTKDEVEETIEEWGRIIQKSVNVKTDLLIIGDIPGASKTKKAKELGIKQIEGDEFLHNTIRLKVFCYVNL